MKRRGGSAAWTAPRRRRRWPRRSQSVGLKYEAVRGKYTNQFSGGELQRISVARALIPNPKLIVADEPVSMIDASRRMIIINLFKQLRDEAGRSFLYITHDLATAYYISDYVAVMNKGVVVEFGDARQVMGDPQHDYTKLLLSRSRQRRAAGGQGKWRREFLSTGGAVILPRVAGEGDQRSWWRGSQTHSDSCRPLHHPSGGPPPPPRGGRITERPATTILSFKRNFR
jgi:ABC-type multidrug transport system ATPase subunit